MKHTAHSQAGRYSREAAAVVAVVVCGAVADITGRRWGGQGERRLGGRSHVAESHRVCSHDQFEASTSYGIFWHEEQCDKTTRQIWVWGEDC